MYELGVEFRQSGLARIVEYKNCVNHLAPSRKI